RAAAGAAGGDGGAAGGHGLDGGADHDRLPGGLRRAGQPDQERCRDRVPRPAARRLRAVRRDRGGPRRRAGGGATMADTLGPGEDAGMNILADTWAYLTDPAHWTGPGGMLELLVQQLLLSVTAMAIALVVGLALALWL